MTLPRWHSRNQRDQDEMTSWVIGRIEQRNEEQLNRVQDIPDDVERYCALLKAHEGDLEPLRALNPDMAVFINPPAPVKGKRHQYNRDEMMMWATELVHFVRDLWRREYGRRNRGRDNPPSAEDIVAYYFRFNEAEKDKLIQRASKMKIPPIIGV